MNNITELLSSMTDIGIRIIGSDTVNRFMTVIFGIILIFGIMNCILGYRLLRFWMMLGGFFVGAALAFVSVYTMGTETKSTYMIAVLVTGIIFAVIAFLIYKAGVFILAAGIGWTLSIYFIRPTSSAVFFACILIGIALGSLAVKYCREVIIVGTSLCGGIMAGISLAKIGDLADFPYGLGLSAGFAVLGMLIQFAINKSHEEDEEEEERGLHRTGRQRRGGCRHGQQVLDGPGLAAHFGHNPSRLPGDIDQRYAPQAGLQQPALVLQRALAAEPGHEGQYQ